MVHQITKYALVIVLWLVIAAGMILRIHNGDYFPIYQNDDGPFYVWLGNSIWDNFSQPSTLTIFEKDNPTIFWRSQYKDLIPAQRFGFRLSDKYFDHPFLAALFMAMPARFFGFAGFSQIPQMLVRLPAFIAALLALILTYKLTNTLFGSKTGLLATALLAFWPTAVLAQRQSYLENMITPVWLFSLWLVWQMKDSPSRKKLGLLIGCGIWAGWTKLAGYILFGLMAYFLNQFKKTKWAKLMLIVGGISLIIYLLYGQLVGGAHFWQTIAGQGNRGAYLTSILTYFRSPQLQGNIEDGWWFLGIIGMVYMATKKQEKYQLIGFSALVWWLTAFFLAGPENTSPWYIYPVYPLLMIGVAVMIKDGRTRFPLVLEMLLFMLGLTGWRLAGIDPSSNFLRIGILGLVGLIAIWTAFPKISRPQIGHNAVISILLIMAILGNIMAVRKVPERVCGIGGCTQPTKIILPN